MLLREEMCFNLSMARVMNFSDNARSAIILNVQRRMFHGQDCEISLIS